MAITVQYTYTLALGKSKKQIGQINGFFVKSFTPPSQSELNSIILHMEWTHLGLEASNYVLIKNYDISYLISKSYLAIKVFEINFENISLRFFDKTLLD